MSIILDDVRLPEKWSKGSSGGPAWLTYKVPTDDGDVYREAAWTNALHRYDIAHNVKRPEDIAELRRFHFARRGSHRGFLLKDWLDWTTADDGQSAPTATDCQLGLGTGSTTTYSMFKRYADPINHYDRPIMWPVEDTVLIAIDGTPQASGFTVNRGEGTIDFDSAPAGATFVTWGCEFDVPVAFEDDYLSITYDTINSRSAGQVVLEEVRSWLA